MRGPPFFTLQYLLITGLFFAPLAGHGADAGGKPAPPLAPLSRAALAPSLRAAAVRDGILLTWKDPGPNKIGRAGDTLVLWAGTTDGRKTEQWLIALRRGPAAASTDRKDRRVKYLSWGPVVTFESGLESIDLWVAGPADPASQSASPAPVQHARVRILADYLRLGLDQVAEFDRHMAENAAAAKREHRELPLGRLYALDQPIDPARIAEARPVAERIGFTPETSRAWVGGIVALQAFYDAVQSVPVLRQIGAIAIERPSLWKLAKLATGSKFGIGVGNLHSKPVDPRSYDLPPIVAPCFDLPFAMGLGKDPIVVGELIVSAPTPPLDVGAGILAVLAVNPHDHSRIVELVTLSAVRGPE